MEIWKWAENKHCSQLFHFIPTPPMPRKYSSFVGNSPSPWISHSFSGWGQDSIYKFFQNSSWLWQKNTKTELLKGFYRGFLIHMGNLLFLMQPLNFSLKTSWRHGEAKEESHDKTKKTRTDIISSQKLRRTETKLRQIGGGGAGMKRWGEKRWVIPLHQLCLMWGIHLENSTPAYHLSWAVRWTYYWP